MKRYDSDLSDEKFKIIEHLLPPECDDGRPRKYNIRDILDAIFYIEKTRKELEPKKEKENALSTGGTQEGVNDGTTESK